MKPPKRLLKKLCRGGDSGPAARSWRQAARSLVPEPALAKAGDEARVGQKGTLTRIWARKGSRPRKPRDTGYEWAYLFGAVCPARATGAAIVMPYAGTEAMNQHLAVIAARITPGAHGIIVLDGAGWHSNKALVTPANLTLITQPPFAPEVNPAENVWEYLRQNKLAIRIYETYDAIVKACCQAWNDLMETPDRIASLTTRDWAQVS